eukprot:TRINITY_DN45715_c0_g1_i1.p1 TRINITY_DN45715_c0_g1~~TRINITY_DN45715_c0_g1_i1.p1  ORF type:complete len:208 (-),score=24.10 TRINITY_DN45715_c0_g1_i1:20-643(-)
MRSWRNTTDRSRRVVLTSLGVFSMHSPIFGSSPRSVVSWNARALICCDQMPQQNKHRHHRQDPELRIRPLPSRSTWYCGHHSENFQKIQSIHVLHYSVVPDASAGGVVTVIRRRAFPADVTFFLPQVLVTGRALASQIAFDHSTIDILNLHNEDFGDEQTATITSWARRASRICTSSPSSHAAIACGDFNYDDDDAASTVLDPKLQK